MKTCYDRTCGNYRPGQPYQKGRDCPRCWNAANRLGKSIPSTVATAKPRLPLGTKSKAVAKFLHPCQHRGEVISSAICAEGCGKGSATKDVYSCSLHGRCTVGVRAVGVDHCCRDCPDRAGVKQSLTTRTALTWPARADLLPPLSRTRVDVPGFNPGMAEHRGTLWFVPRNHERLYLYSLDADTLQPQTRTVPPLALSHPLATNGHEDGRLFVHGGELFIGFVGIKSGKKRHELRISQLYANLSTGEVTAPTFAGVQPVEKNWGWFSHDGELYAVYSISPHVVVRLRDGERFTSENQLPWSGGYLRGGAPPVRVGDRYVCWFHGATEERSGRVYNVGVYEFEAKPPFRVLRQSPAPLLWAGEADAVADGLKRVVFPCGAVLRGDEWLVSSGSADERCEVMRWRANDVDGVLA